MKYFKNIEYSNIKIEEIIDEYIHSKRDREIIKKRLIDGALIEELAEEYEMSNRQMQRILNKNEYIVFKKYGAYD